MTSGALGDFLKAPQGVRAGTPGPWSALRIVQGPTVEMEPPRRLSRMETSALARAFEEHRTARWQRVRVFWQHDGAGLVGTSTSKHLLWCPVRC